MLTMVHSPAIGLSQRIKARRYKKVWQLIENGQVLPGFVNFLVDKAQDNDELTKRALRR